MATALAIRVLQHTNYLRHVIFPPERAALQNSSTAGDLCVTLTATTSLGSLHPLCISSDATRAFAVANVRTVNCLSVPFDLNL
jgi:hypothetical protein